MSQEDKKPGELGYQEAREIGDELNLGVYRPKQLASKWQKQFGSPERRVILNGLAVWTMGLGHIDLAEELVALGADPFSKTPAGWAIKGIDGYQHEPEHAASIPYLLANQDKRRDKEPSELNGVARPRMEVLAYVLANPTRWNANVNEVYQGNSALVVASSRHNTYHRWGRTSGAVVDPEEILLFQEALIKAGAIVNQVNLKHNLLEASLPDYTDQSINFQALDRVLSWGVDINAFGSSAWARAIHEDAAIRYPKKAALGPRAEALRQRGIPLYSPVNCSRRASPLAEAVDMGMTPLVKEMIDLGVDPCWTDPKTKETLLTLNHDPKGNTLLALSLFPKGAFDKIINQITRNGDTALHLAVNSLNAPMTQFLLEAGADIHALNGKKQKPLQAVKRSGTQAQSKFDALLGVLIKYGVDMGADKKSSAMHKAAKLLSASAVRHLVEQGHSVNVLDARKKTPAEMIISGGQAHKTSYFNPKAGVTQVKTLHELVQGGLDLSAPLKNGSTLLHDAVERGSHLVAVYLLENGVDPYVKNSDGICAMHLWSQKKLFNDFVNAKNEPYIMEMIDGFINAGADMDMLDHSGNRPFEKARKLPAVQATLERTLLHKGTPEIESPKAKRMRL